MSSGGGSTTLAPAKESLAGAAYVSEVAVSGLAIETDPDLAPALAEGMRARLRECASGPRPVRLEARIDWFDRRGGAESFFMGKRNVIRGEAHLVDAATGETLGRYGVRRSFETRTGGLIGLAVGAGAERRMSEAFADEVCKRAFEAN